MGTYHVEGSSKNVYIFRRDRDALIDFVRGHPERQATGDLFGLWTTAGEPVIHIVCGQRLCTERGSNFADIAREVLSLSHIGNWRCYDSSEVLQTVSHQLDYPRCSHETRGRFLGLAICIKSTQVILSPSLFRFQKQRKTKVETCNLELLAAESPFKNIEGIKGIALNSRLDECLDEADQMEWSPSQVSKGSPSNSPKHQGHTSVSKALSRKQVDVKVYLFKKDYDMIQELVRCRPTEETPGGDLFGLWTSDDEPVLHIVTAQGREVQRMIADSSSKSSDSITAKREKLGDVLREKYHLNCIGQWQYKRRSERNEMAIIQAVGQEYLRQNAKYKDFVLILVDDVDSSGQVQLSPYLLSQFSVITKVECEILPRESVFRKDEDIREGMETERDYRPRVTYHHSYTTRRSTTGKVGNMDVDSYYYTPSFPATGTQSKKRSTRR